MSTFFCLRRSPVEGISFCRRLWWQTQLNSNKWQRSILFLGQFVVSFLFVLTRSSPYSWNCWKIPIFEIHAIVALLLSEAMRVNASQDLVGDNSHSVHLLLVDATLECEICTPNTFILIFDNKNMFFGWFFSIPDSSYPRKSRVDWIQTIFRRLLSMLVQDCLNLVVDNESVASLVAAAVAVEAPPRMDYQNIAYYRRDRQTQSEWTNRTLVDDFKWSSIIK